MDIHRFDLNPVMVFTTGIFAFTVAASVTAEPGKAEYEQMGKDRALFEVLQADEAIDISKIGEYSQFLDELSVEKPGSYPARIALTNYNANSMGLTSSFANYTKVVGGDLAAPGEIPWQVALSLKGIPASAGQFCGGSLIDKQWVLTAAHCVDNTDKSQIYVAYGSNRLGSGTQVDVEKIIPHEWNSNTMANDIALLKLASEVHIVPGTVELVEVPATSPGSAPPGALLKVSGWGHTQENGTPSQDLRKVIVPIVDLTACNSANFYAGAILNGMICAGVGGKDSCQGDSGGPLVSFTNGSTEQVGVVSWGYGCARPNKPGVYSSVAHYQPWIKSSIANN